MTEKIKILYHTDKIDKLEYIDGKSDWIDLRAAENVVMKQFEFKLIDLGISVQLPEGYEMIIAPRSSTFKNFGLIQTNSIGIVDESYCGRDDVIKMPALAMRDTEIRVNDRICQFRILKHQPTIEFEEVEDLERKSRGGFGSTGKQ
ncbi:MAG: deoxyuridine 5'-triphosphate nucleotidohydrolase [Eubacteriales bacterium]|nr:deoxyuridine 5'-triphosphate nucleotidohydrolase [Eubacteriales bacterium]